MGLKMRPIEWGIISKVVMPPGKSAKRVFTLDVPGIHVPLHLNKKDVDGRDEARP
jgi:hypothetical protein